MQKFLAFLLFYLFCQFNLTAIAQLSSLKDVRISQYYCSKSFDLGERSLKDLLTLLRKNYKYLYSYEGEIKPLGIYQRNDFSFNPDDEIVEGMILVELKQFATPTNYGDISNMIYPLLSNLPQDELEEFLIENPDYRLKVKDLDEDDEDNSVSYTFETLFDTHFANKSQTKFVFKQLNDTNKAVFCVELDVYEVHEHYEKLFLPFKIPVPIQDFRGSSTSSFLEFELVETSFWGLVETYQWRSLVSKVREEIGIKNGVHLPY